MPVEQANLLLADGNERNRRVLEVSLRRAGFFVTAVADGCEAIAKIQQIEPDLVVADTELQNLDGFELCETIRGEPRLSAIPIILLADGSTKAGRLRGLSLGADEYLTRPILIREVVARIRMLLQRRRQHRLATEETVSFSGDITDMAIVDLIQMMELSSRSGTIRLHGQNDRSGTIYVRDGRVIDAEVGSLHAEAALYRLFVWQVGRFEVEFKTIRRPERISCGNESLVVEGMCRVDEWARLLEQLPDLSTVLEIDYEELAARLGEVPDEVNAILRLFDGQRTLVDVIDDSDFSDHEALKAISRLFFEGLVYNAAQRSKASLPPTHSGLPRKRARRTRATQIFTGTRDATSRELENSEEDATHSDQALSAQLDSIDREARVTAPVDPNALRNNAEQFVDEQSRQGVKSAVPQMRRRVTRSLEVGTSVGHHRASELADEGVDSNVPSPMESHTSEVWESPEAVSEVVHSSDTKRAETLSVPSNAESAAGVQVGVMRPRPSRTRAYRAGDIVAGEIGAKPKQSVGKTANRGQTTSRVAVRPVEKHDKQEPASQPSPPVASSSGLTGPISAADPNRSVTNASVVADGSESPTGSVSMESVDALQADGSALLAEDATDLDAQDVVAEETGETVPGRHAVRSRRRVIAPRHSGNIIPDDASSIDVVGQVYTRSEARVAELPIIEEQASGRIPTEVAIHSEREDSLRPDDVLDGVTTGAKSMQVLVVFAILLGVIALGIGIYRSTTSSNSVVDSTGRNSLVKRGSSTNGPMFVGHSGSDETVDASSNAYSSTSEDARPTALVESHSRRDSGSRIVAHMGGATVSADASSVSIPNPLEEYQALVVQAEKSMAKGRRRKAYVVFKKALKLNKKGWEALQRLAVGELDRGRLTQALALARRAEVVNPDAPYAQLVIGAVAHERGKRAEAKAAYKKFLELCPTCQFAGDIRSTLRSMK